MKTKVITKEFISDKIISHTSKLNELSKQIDNLNSKKQYHEQRLKHYQSLRVHQIEIIFYK